MYAYNPRRKSFKQLEKSMVGDDRWDILNGILEEMDIKKGEGPKQHWIIVGPKGIGKSHILTLLYHKVKNNRKLGKKWVPVLFPEELLMAGKLHKFLERVLVDTIQEFDQEENPVSNELVQNIKKIKENPISERSEHFFSLLSWFQRETGKHILLITENLQQLMGKHFSLIEQKKLRAFLQTSDALLIIGSATTVFNALHDYSHPFYHFFHIRRLGDLSFEDMKTLIHGILAQKLRPELSQKALDGDARLRALYSFTGGNPRMAIFLADILSTEVPGEMLELMDRILDELTPYFLSMLAGIPDYLKNIINTLAAFEPAQSPMEISRHLEVPQTSIRNYLKLLKEDGYVKVAFSKGKSNYYCLNEYLYRVWYQMRDSSHREETRWLMELLLMVYSSEEMIEEKAKLEANNEINSADFFYKKLIDQTIQFLDEHPDYCKVFEYYVHAMFSDQEGLMKEPSKEHKMLIEALQLLFNGQNGKADAIFQDIINSDPQSESLFYDWGASFFALGRREEAIEKFRKAIDINPLFMPPYMGMGGCFMANGQYKEAIETFERAEELNLKSAEIYGFWGNCLNLLGKHEEANEKLEMAAELDPGSDTIYGVWGDCLKRLGRYEDAIEKLEKSIELNPKNENTYGVWGDCLTELGRYEEAIDKYKKAMEINPKSEIVYRVWGDCLTKQGSYNEALEKFEKSIELNPESEITYSHWGDCLRQQGKHKEAIKKFKKAVELNPNYDMAYGAWGECLMKLKRYDKAIDKFKKTIELNPDFKTVYWLWGDCLKKLEKYEESITVFEVFPPEKSNYRAVLAYAECLLRVDRLDDALTRFEEIIDHLPKFYFAYLFYGALLEVRKEEEKALLSYLKFIKFSPDKFVLTFGFQDIYEKKIEPLLKKMNSREYVTQFLGEREEAFSKTSLVILLILFKKYDLLSGRDHDILNDVMANEGEQRNEIELLIFTIKMSIWLELTNGNLNDALRLIGFYIEYVKFLKAGQEKGLEVLEFFIDLFILQPRFNIEPGNIQEILDRMKNDVEASFSDVIFKIWTCLSEPGSVEAQRHLNEKAIAEIVRKLKEKAKPQE